MPCRQIIRIGRDSSNDFQIASPTVSASHAILIVGEATQHLVVDCCSANGTRVGGANNGERIAQSMVIRSEDVFFGDIGCNVGEILDKAGISG
jgi:pSer/pThr/pTyr-binding forkhead associated (FHA) protein